VLSKDETFQDSYDILFVLGVSFLKGFQDPGLDQALLIEALFVSEDFEGAVFFLLVVEAFKDLAEGSFADSFDHFKAICNVVMFIADVLCLIIVKSVIINPFWSF